MRFNNLFAIFSVVNSTSYIEGGHADLPEGAGESVAVVAEMGSDAVAVGPDKVTALNKRHINQQLIREGLWRNGFDREYINNFLKDEVEVQRWAAAEAIQNAWRRFRRIRKVRMDSQAAGESTAVHGHISPAEERRIDELLKGLRLRFLMEAYTIEPDFIRICLTGILGSAIVDNVMDREGWSHSEAKSSDLPLLDKLEMIFNSMNKDGVEHMTWEDKFGCRAAIQDLQDTREAAANTPQSYEDGYTRRPLTDDRSSFDRVAERFRDRAEQKARTDFFMANYACDDEITRMRQTRVREIEAELGYSEYLDIPHDSPDWNTFWRLRDAYDDVIKRHVMDKYKLTEDTADALLNEETRGA
jgi:hypothetical protein